VREAFAGFEDLVLVGHSISGLVIPLVAQRRPVKRLILLHAVLPKPGMSLVDQGATETAMFNPEMLKVPPPGWSDEETATRFLFHDCAPAVARDSFLRMRARGEGRGVLIPEVTPLQIWADVPGSYILCRDD
jgi:hypothetical protein